VRIGILEWAGFSSRAQERLAGLGPVEAFDGVSLDTFLADKQILFVRLGRRVDDSFLARAPKLKILCSPTTGLTHLDEYALSRRGILLMTLRGEQEFLQRIHATPEHTLGLILSLLRNYRFSFLDMCNRDWDRDRYRGDGLSGKKVGIIGLGRVGKRMAQYLIALEVSICFFDSDPDVNYPGTQRLNTVDAVLEASEIILLCASFTPRTQPIIDRRRLTLLKGKYLVNTARGELVDEQALLEGIRLNWFRGVATDVISDETGIHRLDDWLQAAEGKNIVITPHIAGATIDAMHKTEEFMVEKLIHKLQRKEFVR
jgi:D-3-phosphoglycerate dehydrogenase